MYTHAGRREKFSEVCSEKSKTCFDIAVIFAFQNYFPATLKIVYLVKPEGVLQRAFEVGYKTILDSCQFPVSICKLSETTHTLSDLVLMI